MDTGQAGHALPPGGSATLPPNITIVPAFGTVTELTVTVVAPST
jgi:hypothetical protein